MKGVVLVGFMGTGKTAVARVLARRLGTEVVDTDALVTAEAGKPISRIFAEDGEPAFRRMETRVLEKLAAASDTPRANVIATGGGIVLKQRNWTLLRALGDVVCLSARPSTILDRVGTADDRPLLAGSREEVLARINALQGRRTQAYAQADWICPTDGLTPEQVAGRILRWRAHAG